MVQYTPPQEILLDYASGSLPEPLALFVASHLTLAPESRRQVRDLEAVGGAMLEDLEPEPVSGEALDALMARLDDADTGLNESRCGTEVPAASDTTAGSPQEMPPSRVPQPLRDYLGRQDLESLAWKERGNQVAEYALFSDYPGFKTRLLRMRAGARVPSHTHQGQEFTLVLQGGFSDGIGHYLPGDVSTADGRVTHQPVADEDEDCICLVVTDAPLKLTGPVGRFLNLFVDF